MTRAQWNTSWLYCFILLFAAAFSHAKETPMQVITWPETGTPVVRFTFGKLKQMNGSSNMRVYALDTMAENLTARTIPQKQFHIYLYDKNKVRVGEDTIALNNVGAAQTVKFQTTVQASGSPVSVEIQDMTQAARPVSLTVNSLPQGAVLKVDGKEVGVTPRLVDVGVGRHTLTFSKEGFVAGNFPLEISPRDMSGGSVSFELGAATFDSIELRDGSVMNGDLVSISGMDVEVRVAGTLQHIDRNKIKRLMLTQREAPSQDLPSPVTPNP